MITEEFHIERIPIEYSADLEQLSAFLSKFHLKYDDDIDYALGIFDYEDHLVGCGCASGSLLKCFAVSEQTRGQNALGSLVARLMQDRYSRGYYDLFVITRAENESLFRSCGLFPLVRTNDLVMLENSPNGAQAFTHPFWESEDASKVVGTIVMNGNPFTKGHRYLVEYAAAHCDVLHLFVVEEDRSLFSTTARFQIIRDGVADLNNVRVHLSGHYMISAATFPTYFLKSDESVSALYSELDVRLFAEKIAPLLHITKRFAGEEPCDPVTAQYNRTMRSLLPQYGIEFVCIPRLRTSQTVISASLVREHLRVGASLEKLSAVLPESTLQYIAENVKKRSDGLYVLS